MKKIRNIWGWKERERKGGKMCQTVVFYSKFVSNIPG